MCFGGGGSSAVEEEQAAASAEELRKAQEEIRKQKAQSIEAALSRTSKSRFGTRGSLGRRSLFSRGSSGFFSRFD
jgi:hypothetical protein